MAVISQQTAIVVHAVAAPLIFASISAVCFIRFHTGPLATAAAFVAIVILMDGVVVAMLILQSFEMFTSFLGTWLPFALIFGSTYLTGVALRSRVGTK